MKTLRYVAEAALILIFLGIFKILPMDTASWLGGWLGGVVGPRLAASRKALKNLKESMPDKTDTEHMAIIKGMWTNLGHVFAEYPHMSRIGTERTELLGHDALEIIKNYQGPVVIFGAHLGNWEIPPIALYRQTGKIMASVYRAPNNWFAEALLSRVRALGGNVGPIPKSMRGTRALVQTMKDGGRIGILIDQKYNEGIPVPFFGRPAMTSTAFVALAQKFSCPLLSCRMERLPGRTIRYRLTFYPSLPYADDAGNPFPVIQVIESAHARLESWIAEHPEQWLWLHRRWPK